MLLPSRRATLTTAALMLTLSIGAPLATSDVARADPSTTPTPTATSTSTPTSAPDVAPADSSADPSEPSASTPASSASDSPAASTGAPEASASGTPSASTSATSSQVPSVAPLRAAAAASSKPSLSFAISPGGSPVAGRYYQDIGTFVFTGVRSDRKTNATVEVWRWSPTAKVWYRVAGLHSGTGGAYRGQIPITWMGDVSFCATLGGSPSSASVTKSCAPELTVRDATISMTKPVSTIDSLQNPVIAGSVSPARAGVKVNVDVKRSDGVYRAAASTTTDRSGRYSVKLSYGSGALAKYWVRTSYVAANRARTEADPSQSFSRIAVLNAKIAQTTAADVAKTYRSGCPVGPSKLRTISMNFYGSDKKMHRGVIIIRSDLTDDLIRAFGAGLKVRFPIDKMNNPNLYGGNDPKQMEAGNTSGFNCRKVTGNPYAQSPHSYGTALDINTKENPYRDVYGKWWPNSGKSYIKRSPARAGMLFSSSAVTRSLVKDKFFWGANWYPDRDYQHFQR